MQKKQTFKTVLLVVGAVLAAGVGFCVVPVSNYIKGRTAPLDATILQAENSTQEVVTISDTELSQLISGELTLDSLADLPGVITVEPAGTAAAGSAEGSFSGTEDPAAESAASPAAAEDPAASATSGTAQDEDTTPAQSGKNDSGTAASKASGTTSTSDAAYEGEVKALVQQLYAVKGRAESGLNACISSAKAEYKSLPPEQQTQSRKIAICMSKAGQLSALQASCDSEVNSIVSQMRKVLKANGQSTALADQALSSYKSQKSARRAALMSQLYH